jgi:hypothetical protein
VRSVWSWRAGREGKQKFGWLCLHIISGGKKKNSPSLRTDASLRGSNEEGLLILHLADRQVESLLHDRSLARVRHDDDGRGEGQTGRAVLQAKKLQGQRMRTTAVRVMVSSGAAKCQNFGAGRGHLVMLGGYKYVSRPGRGSARAKGATS